MTAAEDPPPFAGDVHEFWLSLNQQSRARFARTAKTSVGYIQSSMVHGRKWPRPHVFDRLARACNEAGMPISAEELLVWMYRRRAEQMARTKRRPVIRRSTARA